MKIRLGTIAVTSGMTLVFTPWLLIENPSRWWYLVSLAGLLIAAIAGMGAQMEQLGQGNTGEELLVSIWGWIKKQMRKLILFLKSLD